MGRGGGEEKDGRQRVVVQRRTRGLYRWGRMGGGGGQRQIRFGTSPSRLTRSGHTKPQGAGTIPGGAATGAVLNPKEGAAETGDDSANRISTHFLVKREKEKKKKEKRKEKPALTPSLARKYQLGFSMLK